MVTSARKWRVWATSVVVGVLVHFVGPNVSVAGMSTVNGKPGFFPDKVNNQQALENRGLAGVLKSGTATGAVCCC